MQLVPEAYRSHAAYRRRHAVIAAEKSNHGKHIGFGLTLALVAAGIFYSHDDSSAGLSQPQPAPVPAKHDTTYLSVDPVQPFPSKAVMQDPNYYITLVNGGELHGQILKDVEQYIAAEAASADGSEMLDVPLVTQAQIAAINGDPAVG